MPAMSEVEVWKVCSACRNPIKLGAVHWVCSVSTCNRSRMALVFCTVGCWDSHLSTLRHREAWAVEARAPRTAAEAAAIVAAEPAEEAAPRRVVTGVPAAAARSTASAGGLAPSSDKVADDEVLIVVSRMKKYIKERSQMSTSDAVAEALTLHVRALCDEAIRNAGAEGRKTVLDRDVPRRR